MLGFGTVADVLPFGMKPKKQFEISGTLKRANWKKVNPRQVTQKAFWLHVDEEKFVTDALLEELTSKFATVPAKKEINRKDDGTNGAAVGSKKNSKELKVIDAKAAQNLSKFEYNIIIFCYIVIYVLFSMMENSDTFCFAT